MLRSRLGIGVVATLAILVVACGSDPVASATVALTADPEPTAPVAPATVAPEPTSAPVPTVAPDPTETPATPEPEVVIPPSQEPTKVIKVVESEPVTGSEQTFVTRAKFRGFKTDFTLRTISLSEVISDGVPRDGIPPTDDPSYVGVSPAPE